MPSKPILINLQNVVLSYRNYIVDKCEILKFNKKESKLLTEKLKDISSNNKSKLKYQNIHNAGAYKFLFKNIAKEHHQYMVEFKIKQHWGRLFGFFVGNIFYLRLIKRNHLET